MNRKPVHTKNELASFEANYLYTYINSQLYIIKRQKANFSLFFVKEAF